MAYIPKEHAQFDVLPHCRENGGEVFEYSGQLLQVQELLPDENVYPYGYADYAEYDAYLDGLTAKYAENPAAVAELRALKADIHKRNRKEEWSVLRYIGQTTDVVFGLTHGRCYYWPTCKDEPVFCGVIDDEEFTAYGYDTDPKLWEIVLDPTGMARRTLLLSAQMAEE